MTRRTNGRLVAEYPIDGDPSGTTWLRESVHRLGGKVIRVSLPKPEIEKIPKKAPSLQDAVARLEPEALKMFNLDIELSEEELRKRFISRADFDEVVNAAARPTSDAHKTRAWDAGCAITHLAYYKDGLAFFEEVLEAEEWERIDLEQVEGVMRMIEAGDGDPWSMHGLGEVYWDYYVELVNNYLREGNKARLFLKWDSEIHPLLKRADSEVRGAAADHLEAYYRSMQSGDL